MCNIVIHTFSEVTKFATINLMMANHVTNINTSLIMISMKAT